MKIYFAQDRQDAFLKTMLPQDWPLEFGAAPHLFFIRYADPEPHIRLRIKGNLSDKQHLLKHFEYMRKAWAKDNITAHVVEDQYEPELVRYGQTLIRHAEALFDIDSRAFLQLLQRLPAPSDVLRWIYAVHTARLWLSMLHLPPAEEATFIAKMEAEYRALCAADESEITHIQQLNALCQEELAQIPEAFQELLALKRVAVEAHFPSPEDFAQDGIAPLDWVASLIHLSCNRFFEGDGIFGEWWVWRGVRATNGTNNT